jgi:hypothetical protein
MELERAFYTYREYRDSLNDFRERTSDCLYLIANHRTASNTMFLDILEEELPENDLEGMPIKQFRSTSMNVKSSE